MAAADAAGQMDVEHPPEAVVKTSTAVVLAGLCLNLSLLILVLFLWASRGKRNNQADAFGTLVTIKEVAEEYKSSWSPGTFWPDSYRHSLHETGGSPLPGATWAFLVVWLFVSGIYLVFAGTIDSIEIFRENEHLRAAGCVSAALCLCALWPVLFRVGSDTANTERKKRSEVEFTKDTTRAEPFNQTKGLFLWLAWATLTVAAVLATAGSSILRAWTLPGPQYGTLLFLGPGYGLLAGWLWFASALNCSIAISHASYPSGTVVQTRGDNTYTNRPSIWPVVVAIGVMIASWTAGDPAIPAPSLIALFFFTPKNTTHLFACFILLVSVAIATWAVLLERDE